MCPKDDSHLTIEYSDHYIIRPSIMFHSRDNNFYTNKLGEKGVDVPTGNEYNSGTNQYFLNNKEILEFNDRK